MVHADTSQQFISIVSRVWKLLFCNKFHKDLVRYLLFLEDITKIKDSGKLFSGLQKYSKFYMSEISFVTCKRKILFGSQFTVQPEVSSPIPSIHPRRITFLGCIINGSASGRNFSTKLTDKLLAGLRVIHKSHFTGTKTLDFRTSTQPQDPMASTNL